ncbi:MAG: formylglycine-generating enzyme family protein [Gammaproteobacteria bacterium]|nr:formylglycine-generating enzyme family protein [Gammaproteobacteria bacterium]
MACSWRVVALAALIATISLGRALAEAAPGRPASAPADRVGIGRDAPHDPAPRAIPGSTFRETLRSGGEGPEMVVIPAGRFRMGCSSNDDSCFGPEKPVHQVSIAAPFALSVYEVTFEDYDRFTYPNRVDDEGWGRGRRPVINVSWDEAKEYVAWLSAQTGAEYRLPSEAEWEYAARAGTTTKFSWGNEIGVNRANCRILCGDQWERTAPAGSFAPNGFGLHDMHGNVWEWVEDCWNGSYAGAPSKGGAWLRGDCAQRVLRGGAWFNIPGNLRAGYRDGVTTRIRDDRIGFRVARTLTP